jgi:hypothetical protein
MIPWFIKSVPEKIKPLPPEQIPVARLVQPTTLPTAKQTMFKTLLNRMKEASTWAGLAIIAQFVPLEVGELQVIWEALAALAAVAAIFIPEGKAQEAEQG